MFEELPVSDHTSILPSLLLVLNVAIPEPVVIVVVVTRNQGLVLHSIRSLNVINFSIR